MYLQFSSEPSWLTLAYVFICSFSPQLCLLCACFSPFRLFWVICWHNLVRSLEFEETWTRSPGTQRFLSDNTANSACSASYTWDIIFSDTSLPNRLAVRTQPARGLSELGCLSLFLWLLGLILTFATLINRASFWSGESRRFFSPSLWREFLSFFFFKMDCLIPNFIFYEIQLDSS